MINVKCLSMEHYRSYWTILMKFGNPGNMGICVACFYRDIAGALDFIEQK